MVFYLIMIISLFFSTYRQFIRCLLTEGKKREKPVECRIASNETEQTAILQQRYTIFVEEFSFLPPQKDGKHIEYDKYDSDALLFGVWEKDDLIASCRLILPSMRLGLPTLRTMAIDSDKFANDLPTAEISRILVASKHRIFRKTIKIFQTMQQEINRISSEHGIVQVIGAVEPSLLRLLNCARLAYQPIGPLQRHIGPDRYPIILKLQDPISPLKECS